MSAEPNRSLVVRFPDGSKEFRYPSKALADGDIVWHNGERFRVIDVGSEDGESDFATVERESDLSDLLRSEEGAIHLEEIAADL